MVGQKAFSKATGFYAVICSDVVDFLLGGFYGSFLSIIGFRFPVFEGEDFTLPIFISMKESLHSNVVTDRGLEGFDMVFRID